MKIIKDPNPILRQVAQPVTAFDDALQAELASIEKFILSIPVEFGKFVGLAAPQVAISKRYFFMLGKWYINPSITWRPKAPLHEKSEGCYSLTSGDFTNKTYRSYAIAVKYQDPLGNWHEEKLKGLHCHAFQHELDHLDGILACDHAQLGEEGIVDVFSKRLVL